MATSGQASPSETADDWFEPGLRFECTQCGACCTGPEGYVRFSSVEAQAIARALGVSEDEFHRRFARRLPGVGWSLKETRTEHGLDCVFLDRESSPGKALCSIHAVRPMQCRTWPFWPENVRSARAWERAGRCCEGVGRGPVIPAAQIRIERDRTPRD